jgi:hypothetical protein
MKIWFGAFLAAGLLLGTMPVLAADQTPTFPALKAVEQSSLVTLSDRQLDAIEGQAICFACLNIAVAPQINVGNQFAVFSPGASLTQILGNSLSIGQRVR